MTPNKLPELIKVVGFDLDGTLYNELDFVESGFRAVADFVQSDYGVSSNDFYATLKENLREEGRGHNFDFALKKFGIYSTQLVNELVELYRNHDPNIHLYPCTRKLLEDLSQNFDLALLTDGLAIVQKKKVANLGLNELFDLIIYTDDMGPDNWKPSTVPFRYLLQEFGADPRETVYVGDNPTKDFEGANKLGINTVRVKQGKYKDLEVSRGKKANHCISEITELKELLKADENPRKEKDLFGCAINQRK